MEKFEYLKLSEDKDILENKIKQVWEYYRNDIKCWVESLEKIYNNFYEKGNFKKNEIKNKDSDNNKNKNIEKMKFLYKKNCLTRLICSFLLIH